MQGLCLEELPRLRSLACVLHCLGSSFAGVFVRHTNLPHRHIDRPNGQGSVKRTLSTKYRHAIGLDVTASGAHEVYFKRPAACHAPRWEPRARWPRGSPCARPVTLVKGQPGAVLDLEVTYHADRKHLPIVRVKRAA